jgi:hypothetical protein
MPGSERLVIQRGTLSHIGHGLTLHHGINFHRYRIFGLIGRLVLCIVFVIHATVTLLWHIVAAGDPFFAVSIGFRVLHIAKVVAASDILASAGALVAVSVEVVIVAAFIAFLEAIAILTAIVTAPVRMLAEILSTTAWTVFIDFTRLTALVADPIAVVGLVALVAMLKHDALEAALVTVDDALQATLMAAFLALTNFSAKPRSMTLILVVIGATFFSIPFVDKNHLIR